MRIIGYVAGTVLPRGMVGETKYLETAFDSAENIFFIASDGMHATCGMSVVVCFHCCVMISSYGCRMVLPELLLLFETEANADFVCGRYAGSSRS